MSLPALPVEIDAAPSRPTTGMPARLKRFAYAAAWKKFERLWDSIIRARRTALMLPVLESVLSEFGRRSATVARRC
jgi:hypothetical protein